MRTRRCWCANHADRKPRLPRVGVPPEYVAPHRRIQEQIYASSTARLMELEERTIVRKDDVIFIPPGVEHAIYNTGMTDLRFIVVTSPPDE